MSEAAIREVARDEVKSCMKHVGAVCFGITGVSSLLGMGIIIGITSKKLGEQNQASVKAINRMCDYLEGKHNKEKDSKQKDTKPKPSDDETPEEK